MLTSSRRKTPYRGHFVASYECGRAVQPLPRLMSPLRFSVDASKSAIAPAPEAMAPLAELSRKVQLVIASLLSSSPKIAPPKALPPDECTTVLCENVLFVTVRVLESSV
jgi:hypothetical protein